MESRYSVVHNGTVVSVADGGVSVNIDPGKDCAGCAAQSFCGDGAGTRRKEKVVFVDLDKSGPLLRKGDKVEIGLTVGLHNIAVILMFVVPTLILVVVALMSAMVWGLDEAMGVCAALGSVIAYDLIIFLFFREKIRKKYKWSVIRRYDY